jgi:uncharacterized protein YbjT (DUF2867 family)
LRVLVLGSTGVVGDAIVSEALQDRRVSGIDAVTRRPLKHRGDKLQTVFFEDFSNFDPISARLANIDVVLCALGLSWYQAKDEADYRRVTHDYVLACARTASVANPAVRFCFVSGSGASTTSSQAWRASRLKPRTISKRYSARG